ncbi:MAG: DNA-binding domain-containing protein [Paludibacter sp.]|nr:DNA-binding domain-containing protein [Paludibacter sp.]
MLKYALQENLLTERPDDYSAQTIVEGSYDKGAIINLMLQRGTLVTRTDMLAVLNLFEEVISGLTQEGCTINLPLFNTSFSISGVFEGPMDMFDGGRHKLNVNLSKGVLLRDAETKVKFEKTSATAPTPSIQEVKDVASGKTNETLTPAGAVQLWGSQLRIAGEHPDVGLWFVPETGDAIKAAILITNKPASLIAMIPVLAQGSYSVKVVTQYSGGGALLNTPKVSIFNRMLLVQ